MNVGIYIADNKPSGITRYAINMQKGLENIGIDCIIISDTKYFEYELVNHLSLFKTNNAKKYNILFRVIELSKIVKKNRIDIIVSNGWYHDLISILAKKICSRKFVVIGVVHTRPELWNLRNGIYRKIKSFVIRKIFANENATISVSKSLSDALIRDNWTTSINTIYNPIVSEELIARSKYRKISKNDINLCTVGWISEIKGIDLAIEALALNKNDLSLKLTIIGGKLDEEYYKRIIQQIKKHNLEDKVSFTGPLMNPYDVLDKMDIFLLPSRSEALPTSLVEAMALGIPVIAADCDFGPSEILNNGNFGILVNANNHLELAEAIRKLSLNSDLYQDLSIRSIERAKFFDFKQCAMNYQTLFLKLTKE